MLRQARQQMLRPLEHEIPTQMAENDDRRHDDSLFNRPQAVG
jgi:hypothetical protein